MMMGVFNAQGVTNMLQLLLRVANIGQETTDTIHAATSYEVCTTPGCVYAAHILLTSMNQSSNPCEDFHNYACGNWIDEKIIPETAAEITRFSELDEYLTEKVKVILKSELADDATKPEKMMHLMYKKCMDTYSIDYVGSAPFRDALKKGGGWPMTDKSIVVSPMSFLQNLTTFAAKKFGSFPFITLGPAIHLLNSSIRTIAFEEPFLPLLKEFYENPVYAEYTDRYKEYMIAVAKQLAEDGETEVPPDIDSQMNDVYELQRKISEALPSMEETRNAKNRYKWMTLAEYQTFFKITQSADFPHGRWIDLVQYLKEMVPDEIKHLITPTTKVQVANYNFFMVLSRIISQTNMRTITNFIMSDIASANAANLDSKFEDISFEYQKDTQGVSERSPRWLVCASSIQSTFTKSIGALFGKRYFKESDKQVAMDMVEELISAFRQMLNDSKWMDEETKRNAITKLKNMKTQIGYPDWIMIKEKIEKYYEKLNFNESDSMYGIVEKIIEWTLDREWTTLAKPVNRNEFDTDYIQVNAEYDSQHNTIRFPAGILQPPFFKSDFPAAINFGSIGAVIGHEITHGFDDEGRHYDAMGNLLNWWSPTSNKRFEERAKCMVNQYDNFKIKEINQNVQGSLTLGENLADSGGIRMAYSAYKRHLKKVGTDFRLPGLQNITGDQLVFISWANFWCSKESKEYLTDQVLSDYHSPNRFRIVGPLQNLEEFSKAFNCKIGSKMSPRKGKRCPVW